MVLKLARESAGLSQERFAEVMDCGVATVQGWESGRRQLSAVSLVQLNRIGRTLLRLRASAEVVALLPVSIEADLILAGATDPWTAGLEQHPLNGGVIDLRITELVTWALSGAAPRFIDRLRPKTRRGPSPSRPEIGASDRQRIQANLLELSEYETGAEAGVLLRRQACFLAGLSGLDAPARLSTRASRYLVSSDSWSPSWADARSYVVSRAYRGDPEPLRAFIASAHPSDDCESAALNYTAYWVGDLSDREGDDSFMVRRGQRWRGARMYPHLVERLVDEHPLIDLNIHNLWLLLRSQRGLVIDDQATTDLLLGRIEALVDSGRVSRQSRVELRSIAEGLSDLRIR
ncbi:helix-turn-helix domain-containing protein [Glycomyces sp. MUSA5-2]|uniref:helix-turn-helix domain-containing protein n=1 Tax=Glycomyces sp. MUSA5-2 TaxID=2053002 RepID=UPI00300BE5E1